jgi:hypothetical protein
MSDRVVNGGRWPVDHVLALAPSTSAATAARALAVPSSWRGTGADEQGVWGLCIGSGAEPYQTVVELGGPSFRCSCPSRRVPCKHALALLLLWAGGHVAAGPRPAFAAEWLARLAASRAPGSSSAPASSAPAAREADPDPPLDDEVAGAAASGGARAGRASETHEQPPRPDAGKDKRAAERAARMAIGLAELDRWLADCLRGGLTAPALARYGTWDEVAARLVDSQVPGVANRLKRICELVGRRPGWHEAVLAEMGVLHLLAVAGRRLAELPPDLADSGRTSLGLSIRQADVLAIAPQTETWLVCGRSDTLEDRIVVRRTWLRGVDSGDWALVLSFAAYGQSLSDDVSVGSTVEADVHRYPGRRELRAIIGTVHAQVPRSSGVASTSLAGACDEVGAALGEVPWLERWPVTVLAAPTLRGGRWVLADHTGSLPLATDAETGLMVMVAASRGAAVPVTAEWTAAGLIPLAVHLPDRSIDLGPRGGFHERRWERAA